MTKRIISGTVMGAIALAVIYFGGYAIDIGVLVLAAIAMYEFYNAFKQKGHAPIWGAGIIMLIPIAIHCFTEYTAPGIVCLRVLPFLNIFPFIIGAALFYALAAIVLKHDKYNIIDAAITVFGGAYVAFLFTYFILLRNLEAGAYMLVLAVVGCIGADTAAFFIGSKFGKKKLIPDVSPNKTVAGSVAAFAGGIIACTAYGIFLMALGRFQQFPIHHYVIMGIILGGVAQIGDLCASSVKRYCGIKDFGKIIPGHGGIIDRFDAYLLAVPVVYYYYITVMYFNL